MYYVKRTFKAKANNRVLTIRNHQTITVRLSWLARVYKARKVKKTKERIPRKVQFQVSEVHGMRWSSGWWLWPGSLTIEAPRDKGDRWRRSGREKPHKFRFGYRSARSARFLRIAWAIQLAYCQATAGVLLTTLPPLEAVPPTLGERLLIELGLRPLYGT